MQQVALKLDIEKSRNGSEVWRPCFDNNEMLDTPGNHLIFVDIGDDVEVELEEGAENREAHKRLIELAGPELSRRFGCSSEFTQRITVATGTEYGDGNDWYSRRYDTLTGIHVLKKEVVDVDAAKQNLEALAALVKARCQQGDGGVRVSPTDVATFTRRRNEYRDNISEDLLDLDIRLKQSDDGYPELIWDPKFANGVRKRREKQSTRQKETGRVVPYLTVDEFYKPVAGMREHVTELYSLDYKDLRPCYSRTSRWKCIMDFKTALKYMCQCYGRHSYRWLPEWQAWMDEWRAHGEATWRNFGGREGWRGNDYRTLFDFFDTEVKVRKPGGKAPNWKKQQVSCLVGIPGGTSEEAFLRAYDINGLRQKYPDEYRALYMGKADRSDKNIRRKFKAKEA